MRLRVLWACLLVLGTAAAVLTPPALAVGTAPSVGFTSWTPADGHEFASGSTLYVNTNFAGSANLLMTASDVDGDLDRLDFPGFTGWTVTPGSVSVAPFQTSYAFAAGASDPSAFSVTAWDLAGNSSTAGVTIHTDTAAPTVASFGYPGLTKAASWSVTFSTPGDGAGAGVDATLTRLQRADGTYSGGVCGGYGAFTDFGTQPPSSPATDGTGADGHCYKYQLVTKDRVGNSFTKTSSQETKVDRTAPAAGSASSPSMVNAASVPVTFDTGTDAASGVASWQLQRSSAALVNGACQAFGSYANVGPASPASPYSDTTVVTDTCYQYQVVSTDLATNSATFTAATPTKVDTAAPTAGSVTVGSGWTNAATADIAFDTGTDAGSGIAGWSLERRDGTLTGASCGSLGSWGAIGGASPASPYQETSLATGACHEYRLIVTDNAGNSATYTGANPLSVDHTLPTGTLSAPAATAGTALLHGTTADDPAGVTSAMITYDGPGANDGEVVCNEVPLGSFSCNWYVGPLALPEGSYDLSLTVADAAGNSGVVDTATVNIDQTAPAVSVGSYTPLSGSAYQYASGSTLYANTQHSGSFSLDVDAVDGTGGGVATIDFPDLDGGGEGIWLPAGGTDSAAPWSFTYSWTPGAISPGPLQATVTDAAANVAILDFTVRADILAPVAGSATPVDAVTNASSADVDVDKGNDTGSGVATWALERASAALSADSCGSPGSYTLVATDPATPYSDGTVADATCYWYRVTSTDHVGNSDTFTGATPLKVDRTAPTGTIATPAAAASATTVPLSGTSGDASTSVASATVTYSGPASGNACTDSAPGSTWGCSWDTTALPDGTYDLELHLTDAAGNTADIVPLASHDVDHEAPAITFVGFTAGTSPQAQHASGSTLYYNPNIAGSVAVRVSSSDGNGIAHVDYPNLVAGWTPGGQGAGPSPFSYTYTWAAGAADPATATITSHDTAGSAAAVDVEFVPDAAAPTAATPHVASTPFTFTPAAAITWSATDAGGAPGGLSFDLLQRSATWRQSLPISTTTVLHATGVTSATRSAAFGSTYCYSITATDVVANTSARSGESCIAVPLREAQLARSGKWRRTTIRGAYANKGATATKTGASLSTTVKGAKRVALVATMCKKCGSVKVMLGSTVLKKVSLRSSRTRHRVLLTVGTYPGAGRSGQLKVVVTSRGKAVTIEGLALSH